MLIVRQSTCQSSAHSTSNRRRDECAKHHNFPMRGMISNAVEPWLSRVACCSFNIGSGDVSANVRFLPSDGGGPNPPVTQSALTESDRHFQAQLNIVSQSFSGSNNEIPLDTDPNGHVSQQRTSVKLATSSLGNVRKGPSRRGRKAPSLPEHGAASSNATPRSSILQGNPVSVPQAPESKITKATPLVSDTAAGPSADVGPNQSIASGIAQGVYYRTPSHRPHSRLRTVTRPLPRVLFLHTGGTLGMDPEEAFEEDESHNLRVRAGATEGSYKGTLRPGEMLSSLLTMVPELEKFANVDLQVLFNKDSSRVSPADWITIARALDNNRPHYDAFVVVHGTDTLAYTAAALSLMLCGFKKPIILTGSQLPLRAPRTDARQNLLDSIQVATSAFSPPHVALQEVAVCFGGKLMRGNRTQKVNSAAYQAFDSLTYPYLATLGIDVDWNTRVLLRVEGAYKPRFKLDPRVIRIPVVPGSDPRIAYGDLYGRGVRGVVLEAFGVGNLPDQASYGWLPWLKDQTAKGLQVCLTSQCFAGPLQPSLYRAGQLASQMGVNAGPHMTPECASVKLMFCLKHPDLALGVPLAGEL
ncbi:hypothetical protein VaNZ11_004507 [Volvox africanus]|uniref:asparaginase n=1 Tax=Volvox africanus TaxID=51714 RepID=A0ABQ5RWZ3_9CHLO|nr:hypothetical protein VaNZ11_004507 [Volvox africanus]